MPGQVREYGGLKLGEEVRVLARSLAPGTGSPWMVAKVRRLGPAGFLVRGLATCFCWEDENVRWVRIERTGHDRRR